MAAAMRYPAEGNVAAGTFEGGAGGEWRPSPPRGVMLALVAHVSSPL